MKFNLQNNNIERIQHVMKQNILLLEDLLELLKKNSMYMTSISKNV